MLSRRDVLHRTSLLLGFAITGSTAAAVLSGCRSTPSLDWTPVFLDASQATSLDSMLDHLLPKTGTPGARDLQVVRFVDAYLKDYASAEEQTRFTTGLADFEGTCRTMFGRSFDALSSDAKDQIFRKFEDQSPGLAPTIWGGQVSDVVAAPVFYRQFKQLALVGYFTSTEVGEKVLAYDPIPGRFDGCIPLASVGKAWSL